MELKRVEYADCYHGLLKLILENDGIASCFMNTRSWGIEYKENEFFDIERSHFNARLEKYFGFKVLRELYNTADEYIGRIKEALALENSHVLIKVDVSSCPWNSISTHSTIYHFLLVLDCTEDGFLKCIDIFFPETYHEYDLASNIGKVRKITVIQKNDHELNLDMLSNEFVENLRLQLEKRPSYSEDICSFAESEFLKNIFTCEDRGEYDKYLIAMKRIYVVRMDMTELLKIFIPKETELIAEWEERIVKQWRKICNFLIKNTIVQNKHDIYIDKTRAILKDLGENEEVLSRRILNCFIDQ